MYVSVDLSNVSPFGPSSDYNGYGKCLGSYIALIGVERPWKGTVYDNSSLHTPTLPETCKLVVHPNSTLS